MPSAREAKEVPAGVVAAIKASNRTWAAPKRAPKIAASATRAPSTMIGTNGGWNRVAARRAETSRLRRMQVMPASRPHSAVAAGAKVQIDR